MIFATVESLLIVDPTSQRVLLDGCFDPVHHGHIRQIRDARHAFPESRIVVGVASDADVRAKGREPLFGQITRCAIVDGVAGVDYVLAKNRPLHALIAALQPSVLVKGKDWEGKLDPETLAACALYGVQIVYLGETLDSSSDRLRRWAAIEDANHLERLEAIVGSQQPASEPWQPVTDYSFEARKAIEGEHPRLIAEIFSGCSVLDVGCGPGHLMTLLGEYGVCATGIDIVYRRGEQFLTGDIGDPMLREFIGWDQSRDLVICREVLEHIPLRQIPRAVANLCQLAGRFVYVTTRFTPAPAHLLKVDTSDDLDPTHISMLNQDLLRTLFVLNGGKRRKDLETRLDWQGKGRVLVYQVN